MPPVVISNYDKPNWQYRAAGNGDILQTSVMGDCWALVVVNPDGSRLLAHLPAGDANQLNGGGLAAINRRIIVPWAVVTIVRGLVNQYDSPYWQSRKYETLQPLAVPATPAQTRAGFFMFARVDATGTVTAWNRDRPLFEEDDE
jgi:hypothetical protein